MIDSILLPLKFNSDNLLFVSEKYTNVLSVPSSRSERGDAHERLCGLVDPRHPQGYQPPDPQGEDPHGGTLYERGTGQEAGGAGQPQPGQLQFSIIRQPQPSATPLATRVSSKLLLKKKNCQLQNKLNCSQLADQD